MEEPSLAQFKAHFVDYASTLYCPCNQLSISYQDLITFNITYHQICSSDFVQEPWIKFLSSGTYANIFVWTDFRIIGATYFRILSTLCRLANTAAKKSINEFFAKNFLNSLMLSESQFDSRIQDAGLQFQSQAISHFPNTIQVLRDFVHGNAFVSIYALNWRFQVPKNASDRKLLIASVSMNDNCSCGTRKDCTTSGPFHSLMPAWVLGCSILEGIIRSSLESLYNQTVINALESFLINSDPIYLPNQVHATSMNSSINSRFPLNAHIEYMIDELFIEKWVFDWSYLDFYHQCAPSYCLYSTEERQNMLVVISRILSFYGGLTVSFRVAAPLFAYIFIKVQMIFIRFYSNVLE